MLVISGVFLLATVAALAWRPRSGLPIAVGTIGVAFELATGAVGMSALERAGRETVPLALFLVAALWLAQLADGAGLAGWAAGALDRAARGRRAVLYGLVCVTCAVLTATVSLDGAVVLMVPLVARLAAADAPLGRVLLLGTVAVANAFSLAVPQGNPTNLVVMERLGLGPAAFVSHLLVPALAATVVCALAAALAGRRALAGVGRRPLRVAGLDRRGRAAAGVLVVAAAAAAAAPWLGFAPWWALCAVAGAAYAAALVLRRPVPGLPVPWRISGQVAVLVVLVEALPGAAGSLAAGGSLLALLAVALGAAILAGAANNLPASVALAGVLGAPGPSAWAALAGLTVGAIGTPHGSVATLIAFDRAGPAAAPAAGAHLRLWLPAAALATATAATVLWLGAR